MADDEIERLPGCAVREIPRCLSHVINLNQQCARLRLATAHELAQLTRVIPASSNVDGAVRDWRLIVFAAHYADNAFERIHLLGANDRHGLGVKITSPVIGLDPGTGLAATRSGSVYRLVGPQGLGEPTVHQLLLVCGALWSWGHGERLGVPHVWY
ncbi:hypothetical protein AZOA_39770 [Azoarcus sp. Aa7]|nr:hypothetical protein [Azoarcus sp. Aa7]